MKTDKLEGNLQTVLGPINSDQIASSFIARFLAKQTSSKPLPLADSRFFFEAKPPSKAAFNG